MRAFWLQHAAFVGFFVLFFPTSFLASFKRCIENLLCLIFNWIEQCYLFRQCCRVTSLYVKEKKTVTKE